MEGEGRQTKAQMSSLALSIHTHVLTILPVSSGTIHLLVNELYSCDKVGIQEAERPTHYLLEFGQGYPPPPQPTATS